MNVPNFHIFGGNLRLAVLKGSLTYYYHKDHLGSTGAITDDTGAKVESAEYHPFGTTREHTGSNVSDYKFTDQELDNETNLYNYDARLYDPVLGMFVTPDSIVPDDYDPQLLNRFSYCRNNPLIYTDPSGHKVTIEINREWPSGISTPGSFTATSNVTGKSALGVTLEFDPFNGNLAKAGSYQGTVTNRGYPVARIDMNVTIHDVTGTPVTGGPVQIHVGNTVANITGCIMPGLSLANPDTITGQTSVPAMNNILGVIYGEGEA
jgi:RHS repeat-associated protein